MLWTRPARRTSKRDRGSNSPWLIRLDDHEKYGEQINPRAHAVWHATDQWTLKGGVAHGPKAPELRAVIPDYAVVRRDLFTQFGNPALKPESSINYEATAMWSNRGRYFSSRDALL